MLILPENYYNCILCVSFIDRLKVILRMFTQVYTYSASQNNIEYKRQQQRICKKFITKYIHAHSHSVEIQN